MNTKMVLVAFVVLGCVCLAFGDVAISLPSTHPDHPDQCWDKKEEKAYHVGDKWSPDGSCQQVECVSDFSFSYEGCGPVLAGEGFKVVSDATKPWPHCCPTIVPDEE